MKDIFELEITVTAEDIDSLNHVNNGWMLLLLSIGHF